MSHWHKRRSLPKADRRAADLRANCPKRHGDKPCLTLRDCLEKDFYETDPENDLLDDPVCDCRYPGWCCVCDKEDD